MKKEEKNLEKNNKKMSPIVIITLVLLVAVLIFGIVSMKPGSKGTNNTNKEEEVKYNTNENVVKDKEINGILFTDIQCSYDGENSILTYKIVNNTTEVINLKEYEVIVKDKDGATLAMIEPNLDQEIKPGESFDTGNAINIDLSSAYSMELNLNKSENETE